MPTSPGKRRRFKHARGHRDKPGECHCKAPKVPEVLAELLRKLPVEVFERACAEVGHPSFWLESGFRYRCLCGSFEYHD
jgi:hypothetical protein